jgi:hypothetical protein
MGPHLVREKWCYQTMKTVETLVIRIRALSGDYVLFLLEGLLRWGAAAAVACAVFVLGRWVIGTEATLTSRGLRAVGLAAVIGIALRLLQELFPRDILVDGGYLVVHHSNWSTSRYPLSAIGTVCEKPVGNGVVRFEILMGKGRPKRIIFGSPERSATTLSEALAAGMACPTG